MERSIEERVDDIDVRLDRLTHQMELADKRMERLELLWDRTRQDWDRTRQDWERTRQDWEFTRENWDRQREEGDRQRAREWKDFRRQMAEMSDRIGRFTEDVVAPNIPRLAREWGLESIVEAGAGIKRRAPGDPSRIREFDYLYLADEGVLWSEAKTTPRLKYLEDFVAALDEAGMYFPEWIGKPLYAVFGSLDLPPSSIAYLGSRGVFALTLGDDTMEVRNPETRPRLVA